MNRSALFDASRLNGAWSGSTGLGGAMKVRPLSAPRGVRELEDRVRDLEAERQLDAQRLAQLTEELRLLRAVVRDIEYQLDSERMGAEVALVLHRRRRKE